MPAVTNTTQPPAMIPPKGELPPSAWEAYGWLGALAISVIALFVVFMARKRVTPPIDTPAPETVVRQRLGELPVRSATPEDALKMARALREYLIAIFFIPSEALTTEELLPLLRRQKSLAPELLADTETLLRNCDHIAFDNAPHLGQPAPAPMVEQVRALVERFIMEEHSIEQTRASVTAGPANP
jgi:hypothetical protein